MLPKDIPAGPVVVDADVFSMVHYNKGRGVDLEPFLIGRPLMLAFCTVGELRAGAIKASWGEKQKEQLESFIRAYTVVRPTSATVHDYAFLHAALHHNLKGGGINDMWTAAVALALDLPIITNNLRDFRQIRAVQPRLILVHPDL